MQSCSLEILFDNIEILIFYYKISIKKIGVLLEQQENKRTQEVLLKTVQELKNKR